MVAIQALVSLLNRVSSMSLLEEISFIMCLFGDKSFLNKPLMLLVLKGLLLVQARSLLNRKGLEELGRVIEELLVGKEEVRLMERL